jgi:hypothetical protein
VLLSKLIIYLKFFIKKVVKIMWNLPHLQRPFQRLLFTSGILLILFSAGCAIQTAPIQQKEGIASVNAQKAAQKEVLAQTPSVPTLKRKIALGRITNETSYGRSLLRDRFDDPLGKQVTDLMSKSLTESGEI